MSSSDLFRSSQSDMASNASKSSSKQRKSTTFLLPTVEQQCSETNDSIGELNYSNNSSSSMRRRLSKYKLVREFSSSNRLGNSKSTGLTKSKDTNKVKSPSPKKKQDDQDDLLYARLTTPKVFNYFTSNFSSSSSTNLNYPQRHAQLTRVSFDLESSKGLSSSRRGINEPNVAQKDSNTNLPKLALASKENLLTHHSTWLPSNSSKVKVSPEHSKAQLFFPLLIHNSSSPSTLSTTSKLSDSKQNELTNKGFFFMQSMSFINTKKQIL